MWKWKEDEKPHDPFSPQPPRSAVQPTAPVSFREEATKEVRVVEAAKPFDSIRAEVAHIGKSVVIRGELSGSEDLYLDGEVEGSIELHGHNLTVGPNGRVRARVEAREVVILGQVEGKVHGRERVELKKSAVLVGDIITHRIVIEDGAYLKGGVDIQKDQIKELATKTVSEPKRESAAMPTGAAAAQAPLAEVKK